MIHSIQSKISRVATNKSNSLQFRIKFKIEQLIFINKMTFLKLKKGNFMGKQIISINLIILKIMNSFKLCN